MSAGAEAQKRRYYRLKAEGRCTCCGKPVEPGSIWCSRHRRLHKDRCLSWHRKNALEGKCIHCGTKLSELAILLGRKDCGLRNCKREKEETCTSNA